MLERAIKDSAGTPFAAAKVDLVAEIREDQDVIRRAREQHDRVEPLRLEAAAGAL